MPWLQAHVLGDAAEAPLIELLLESLGALSVTITDAGDEPILEPAPGDTRLWRETRVTGLFDANVDREQLYSAISQALGQDVGERLKLETLADQDWARAWLDRFEPMRFGDRLWIRPSGFQVDDPEAVIVDLDPGLAFGTGTHPTTSLCLRWLDQHDIRGLSVIDFGCGSGILGIAALKLGARSVVAIDHDPQALQASADNAERNQCRALLDIRHSTDELPPPADLVVANILASTLIELRDSIGPLVKPGGNLLLSGILDTQADAVASAYARDFDFAPPAGESDWVMLHATRRDQQDLLTP